MELIKWVRQSNGFVHKQLTIRETEFGSGVFAKASIIKGAIHFLNQNFIYKKRN